MATAIQTTTSKLKFTPDWQVWSKRPICKLWEGLHLASNVLTNRNSFKKIMNDEDDLRLKNFKTYKNSAIKALTGPVPRLVALRGIPEDIDNAEFFLPDFVAWVETQKWKNVPKEFINLKEVHSAPPEPADWDVWRDKPYLTIKEAVSLLLDISPNIHSKEHKKIIYKDFFVDYEEKKDTVIRKILDCPGKYNSAESKTKGNSKIRPNDFVAVLVDIGWDVPDEFQKMAARSNLPSDKQLGNPQKETSKKAKSGTIISNEANEEKPDILLASLVLLFAKSIKNKREADVNLKVTNKFFRPDGSCKINPLSVALEEILRDSLINPFDDKKGNSIIGKRINSGLEKFKPEFVKKYIFSDQSDEEIPNIT